jgi:uncharacterized protein
MWCGATFGQRGPGCKAPAKTPIRILSSPAMPILAAFAALLVLGLVFGPSAYVRHVIRKHGVERDDLPGTGGELARHLLDGLGLNDVKVEATALGDHYDPETRVVRLINPHFSGRSVSAVAVAAHEVSHAAQHARGEPAFLRRLSLVKAILPFDRAALVVLLAAPFVFAALKSPVLLAGQLALGVLLMAGRVVVHALTLPVEFDASFNKALPVLERGGYLPKQDLPAARSVLRAAALTYVAAALISILNLLRFVRP